eukprot:SAG31_NODE_818_length_11820_cov_22.864431_8_plen_81_part_00
MHVLCDGAPALGTVDVNELAQLRVLLLAPRTVGLERVRTQVASPPARRLGVDVISHRSTSFGSFAGCGALGATVQGRGDF